MRDPVFAGVVLSGALVTVGLFLAVLSFVPRPVRLDEALALLDPSPSLAPLQAQDDADRSTRFGQRMAGLLRLSVSEQTRRTLSLQGRTVGDFFTQKFVLAMLGLVAPPTLAAVLSGLGAMVGLVPLGASLVGALVGWFQPDWSLRSHRTSIRADAAEALFTFFDLVTLERLANQSATQSLAQSAAMSDSPLFVRLRTTLERARLEQRPPWQHLHQLADELELPELGDLADVMRLDEQGAALADSLRARVAELRDGHLLAERSQAQQVSERMTLWMTIPTMIFGLFFLVPPLLKLVGVQ